MPDIFAYTDFRLFLADYYPDRKEHNPSFSCTRFPPQVGFLSSPTPP